MTDEDAYWDYERIDDTTFLIRCDSQKTRDVLFEGFRKNFFLKKNQLTKKAALSFLMKTRNYTKSKVLEKGLINAHILITKMRIKEQKKKKGSL